VLSSSFKLKSDSAINGAIAVQKFQDSLACCPYRVIFIDVNMPVMDGLEFLKQCRAEHGPSEPIIVLCTTEAGIDRIVEALAAGAQEYIMKPFDAGILHDKFVQAGLLSDAA